MRAQLGAAGIFIFGAKLNCAGFLADPKLILILVRAQLGGGLLTAGRGIMLALILISLHVISLDLSFIAP